MSGAHQLRVLGIALRVLGTVLVALSASFLSNGVSGWMVWACIFVLAGGLVAIFVLDILMPSAEKPPEPSLSRKDAFECVGSVLVELRMIVGSLNTIATEVRKRPSAPATTIIPIVVPRDTTSSVALTPLPDDAMFEDDAPEPEPEPEPEVDLDALRAEKLALLIPGLQHLGYARGVKKMAEEALDELGPMAPIEDLVRHIIKPRSSANATT